MKNNITVSDVYYNDNFTNYANVDLATIELFKGYPDGLLKFAAASCIIFILIGIPGNLLTIIALARYKKVHNATAIFIINLSCSDLFFCCINFPIAASTFWQRSWTHGHILCKIFPFARYTFFALSILTILSITINRYVMIAHPRLYPKIYKRRHIYVIIPTLWIIAMAGLIATWFEKFGRFELDPKVGTCTVMPDKTGRSPKKFLALTGFLLPCAVMLLCYARMFYIVRKTTKKSLLTVKKAPKNLEESSSTELSTPQITRAPTTNSGFTYISSKEHSRYLNRNVHENVAVDNVSNVSTKNEPENKMETRVALLQKSRAFLKLSLPTRKDRRLGTMIIAIMISFCACHLPITITKVFIEVSKNPKLCIASYILLSVSSSINPVLYVVMSQEYRKAYKYLLRRR